MVDSSSLTWSFFIDGFLRGKTGDQKIKKTGKLNQKFLHKFCLMPSKHTWQCHILYTVCRCETGQRQQKAIIKWDKVSRKLSKQCFTKRAEDISSALQTKHTMV